MILCCLFVFQLVCLYRYFELRAVISDICQRIDHMWLNSDAEVQVFCA